jgi:cysteinyl-tRNA synthetase
VFPHHENELAQSRSAHGTAKMATIWMHNGFLQVEGKKMSKSLGNFVTINELLATEKFGGRRWPGEVLRLAMLMTHYREPIDFSLARLQEAEKILTQLYRCFDQVWPVEPSTPDKRVIDALDDDLNTSAAINVLRWSLADSTAGQAMAGFSPAGYQFKNNAAAVLSAAKLLGLMQVTPADWLRRPIEISGNLPASASTLSGSASSGDLDEQKIERLITARLAARNAKNFAEADRIRKELEAMGIMLMDAKNKDTGEIETTWEVKR